MPLHNSTCLSLTQAVKNSLLVPDLGYPELPCLDLP